MERLAQRDTPRQNISLVLGLSSLTRLYGPFVGRGFRKADNLRGFEAICFMRLRGSVRLGAKTKSETRPGQEGAFITGTAGRRGSRRQDTPRMLGTWNVQTL